MSPRNGNWTADIRPRFGPKAVAAIAALAVSVGAGVPDRSARAAPDEPPRPLPFSDDVPPPPPLPEPLDRRFRGELLSFDGDRVKLRWTWKSAEELEDFDPFVPVRATVSGGFTWREGALEARETGGLRLRLGMLSDLKVGADAVLHDPHDLGVVLVTPGNSDESILCLVQDRYFTRFDSDAGNATMINKLGGIPASAPGVVEFRYVDRKLKPELGKGHRVHFDVVRNGPVTSFTITPKGEEPVALKGRDTDTPYTKFQPGIYVAGASADFGELVIEGRIDPAWCTENDVLPFVAGDLLHPGNRFAGPAKKAAEAVERFVRQDPAADDPKTLVAPAVVAAFVGDVKLPLVIRMRAAEALADSGGAEGGVAERVARLLDAPDLAARVLAWRVLRPRLPWHFAYVPDAEPARRREAALLVGHYLREHADEEAQGKVFVDGYWYTAARADQIRAVWDTSWDLRTPRVRLRTNLPRRWADWYLAALEAGFAEIVRVVGREPPPERLPLSVFVFATKDDYQVFCAENGYEEKAEWGRFADLDRGVGFETFAERDAPLWSLNLLAKLHTRAATGLSWPGWFEEGRASWFGNPEYRTARFDGTSLTVGLPGRNGAVGVLANLAAQSKMWPTSDFLGKDPRTLQGEDRRVWYAHAWALHAYLMGPAPEEDRRRFADWQTAMERLKASPREVESIGQRLFLSHFQRDLAAFDQRFRAWVQSL